MNIANSERLNYSMMTANDIELLFELDQDPQVMKYINHGKTPSFEDYQQVFIPRLLSYTNADEGWGMWKVTELENQSFIGWVLVRPMEFFSEQPDLENLELGWRFMRSSWGKGYATEAAEAVKQALVQKGHVRQFTAYAVKGNTASTNIMLKLGMKYIKTDINRDPLGDHQVVYYQMQAS